MSAAELVRGEWLAGRLLDKELQILDPRPPVKYFSGHIAGALNVRADRLLETLKREGAAAAAQALGKAGVSSDSLVVVYDDADGQLACTLAWILEYLGHERVFILGQRLQGWLLSHGHKALRPTVGQPTLFEARPRAELRATLEEVRAALGRARLLDVRSREEFTGELKLHARAGRIPGAINLPWLELLGQGDELFLSGHQIRAKLGPLLESNAPVITYCSTGTRACVAYYALRWAGLEAVKVYDGSFDEWASNRELPVEE
ncbi:MAG: hypothetical protein C4339_03430 [Nitrososphaerota archaeon]